MTVAATSELHEIRKRAADSFEAQGYPTKRNEEWKYTSVARDRKSDIPQPRRRLLTGTACARRSKSIRD